MTTTPESNQELLDRLDAIAQDVGYEIALAGLDERPRLVHRFLEKLAAAIAAGRAHRNAA